MGAKSKKAWLPRALVIVGLVLTIIYGALLRPNYAVVEYCGYLLLIAGLVWLYLDGSKSDKKSLISYAIAGLVSVALVVLYIYMKH